ncbi:Acid protease [Yarrowia sp. B02]|nr:Acid protease [Yarrowia sp. B02]
MKSTFLLATLASLSNANYIRAPAEYSDFRSFDVSVAVGNPPQQVDLWVDTGSSDTWVSDTSFNKGASASFVHSSVPVKATYMDGMDWEGTKATERVSVAGSIVNNANIGVLKSIAERPPWYPPFHGYMGLSLEEGEQWTPRYPNLLSQMKSQGLIRRRAFGVYINGMKGEVLFGGYDQDRIKGKLRYVPLVNNRLRRIKNSPTPYEYDVLVTAIMRNNKDILKRPGSRPRCVETYDALLDTGYTEFEAPQHVINALAADFGAKPMNGELYITKCNSAGAHNTYTFDFNGVPINVPGKAFLMPVEENSDTCRMLMRVHNKENRMVLGLPFFRYVYVYFDAEAYQVGLAEQNPHASGRPQIVTGSPHTGSVCWMNVNGLEKCI